MIDRGRGTTHITVVENTNLGMYMKPQMIFKKPRGARNLTNVQKQQPVTSTHHLTSCLRAIRLHKHVIFSEKVIARVLSGNFAS